jgi:hypothetical protein
MYKIAVGYVVVDFFLSVLDYMIILLGKPAKKKKTKRRKSKIILSLEEKQGEPFLSKIQFQFEK